MKISLRPVLIGLILLVGVIGLTRVVPATSVDGEATQGACTPANPGVTLVVDFGVESKLTALVKCATDFNSASSSVSNELNGWQVFEAAEVSVEGTLDFPVGFACRIDDFPKAIDQGCQTTPSYAEGHWTYFFATAAPAQGWQFSGTGATNRKPTCGSVEGWLFVKGEVSSGTESSVVPSIKPEPFKCQR